MGSRVVLVLPVVAVIVALGACGTGSGGTVATTPATAEQRQRFGLAEGTRVLLALDSSRNQPGRRIASFTAPANYSLTATCDGEVNVTVATGSVSNGRRASDSFAFKCRRSPIVAAPRKGKADTKLDVDVYDNEAGTWWVIFFVPPATNG
jgi:hypothetical protein